MRNAMTPFSAGTQAVKSLLGLDPDAGAWVPLPPMQKDRTRCAAVGAGPFLYVLGGEMHRWKTTKVERIALANVERFDADSWTWDALPALPKARGNLGAVMVSGHIYAIGGFSSGCCVSAAERLSLNTRTCEVLPCMPTAREGMAVAALGERIFAVGGKVGSEYVGTMESFHLAQQVWETLAWAPAMIKGQCSAVVHDNYIYVCGGYAGDGKEKQWQAAGVKRYDPEAGMWDSLPGMAVPRRGFAMAAIDSELFTVGGYKELRVCNATETLQLGSTSSGWSPGPAFFLPIGHGAAASIRLPRWRARACQARHDPSEKVQCVWSEEVLRERKRV